jgi:hypothetical protein
MRVYLPSWCCSGHCEQPVSRSPNQLHRVTLTFLMTRFTPIGHMWASKQVRSGTPSELSSLHPATVGFSYFDLTFHAIDRSRSVGAVREFEITIPMHKLDRICHRRSSELVPVDLFLPVHVRTLGLSPLRGSFQLKPRIGL